MNPSQIRKYNVVFGSVFLLLGALSWGGAAYFVAVPRVPIPPPQLMAEVDPASCRAALSELGYTVSERNGELIAFEPMGAFPREQLEKASVVATVCRMPMHTFCMGEACERPGLTISLKRAEKASELPKAANVSKEVSVPPRPNKATNP